MEFRFKTGKKEEYYASVVLLPKANGHLSAVILQSLDAQKYQIYGQRLVFLGADTAALLLLVVFFWIFTGKTLAPLEENRRQQAQFIASASHELRSPLSVMLSCLTASQKAAPEEAARFTDTIQLEGKRMSRLIDDMLQLAGADACSWTFMAALVSPDTLLLRKIRISGQGKRAGAPYPAARRGMPLYPLRWRAPAQSAPHRRG